MKAPPETDWTGASPERRGAALVDLLDLSDALPQGLRPDGSPSLAEKVVAVDRALHAAGVPHALGGALALAYYGEPRGTVDIDVNVFVRSDRLPEIEYALPAGTQWDRNRVHLFFSEDALHAEMEQAVRRVPFADTEIGIVAPEHLVIRKAMLDRTKDWLDIEAILTNTSGLDVKAIEGWLRRLAGDNDPRLAKFNHLAARLITCGRPSDLK